MENYQKPTWWRLYAIVPFTLTLLAIESQLALPDLGHKLIEILIVVVTVGLMGLWVMANAVALEYGDASLLATVTEAVPQRAVARGGSGRSVAQAPVDTDALVTLRNS